MKLKAFGHYLINKLTDIVSDTALGASGQWSGMYEILSYFYDELSKKDVQLSSMYSKMSYLNNKFKVDGKLNYYIHGIRKQHHKISKDDVTISQDDVDNIYHLSRLLIAHFCMIPKERNDLKYLRKKSDASLDRGGDFIGEIRAVAIAYDEEHFQLTLIIHEQHVESRLLLNDFQKEGTFHTICNRLTALDAFPIELNLLSVKYFEDKTLNAQNIIIDPNYLFDITQIASCFQWNSYETDIQKLNRFLPANYSFAALKGQIVNYLFDVLIHNPEKPFKEITTDIFQLQPLGLSKLNDSQVKEFLSELELHYTNIKQVILREMKSQNIAKRQSYIEPSFLSPKYGIQGRLDFLHVDSTNKTAHVIELKSGKVFKPNSDGINNAHYAQTMMYYSMVRSILPREYSVAAFVLYSKINERTLRYATPVFQKQLEAVEVRNLLYVDQMSLETTQGVELQIDKLLQTKGKNLSGYQKTNWKTFKAFVDQLSELERKYYYHFVEFIAKEQRYAKLGTGEFGRVDGLASIWTNTVEEKKEAHRILNNLNLTKSEITDDKHYLYFKFSEATADLSNFRIGDIVIVYPYREDAIDGAARTQILKASIIQLDDSSAKVELRGIQYNQDYFEFHKLWNIEPDQYDSSLRRMYSNLGIFLNSNKETRNILLGLEPPRNTPVDRLPLIEEFTEEQQEIFDEIISAEDYYLLWGPPGTGKTSFVIKHVVRYLFEHTDENILLLAFTNKAVDQICEAIVGNGEDYESAFIRIGSRTGTDERFQKNLLIEKSKLFTKRTDLRQYLESHRIFVGTLASIQGKQDIFSFKKFDRVIIDEASQLLEPQILGLLSEFKKSILIGDHRQLPAVVLQPDAATKVHDEELNAIGLYDKADSLFERLYKKCEANNWYWAIGQLTRQGRMHDQIMEVPNHLFYDDLLLALPQLKRLHRPIEEFYKQKTHPLFQHRTVYVPSQAGTTFKTNEQEATIALQTVQMIQEAYQISGKELTKDSIGIITPYRAQIANIRKIFTEAGLDNDDIQIDTVERYQGGAKDIIIISMCLNFELQLETLPKLNSEGIDRKLNVALTRAREQIIVIGNRGLMSQNKNYKAIIDSYALLESEQLITFV